MEAKQSDDEHRELLENTQEFLRAGMVQLAPDSDVAGAWDEFYRVYSVLIRRFVIARGLRGSDVEDCIQNVWVDIARRLMSFQITTDAGLRSWLFTLVRSRATDMFRRQTRAPAIPLGDAIQDGLQPESRELDPASQYDEAWDTALVETMILKLEAEISDLNFEIFRLRSLEGIGVQETSDRVGVTSDQVRYRHHRSMKKLKAIAAKFIAAADEYDQSGS